MQGSDRVRSVALGNDIPRASFALAALGGHAEFELDFVEAHSGARMASDFTVRDSTAHTDDHGKGARAGWLLMVCGDYKYESLAFAISMTPAGCLPAMPGPQAKKKGPRGPFVQCQSARGYSIPPICDCR